MYLWNSKNQGLPALAKASHKTVRQITRSKTSVALTSKLMQMRKIKQARRVRLNCNLQSRRRKRRSLHPDLSPTHPTRARMRTHVRVTSASSTLTQMQRHKF
jgi:hypothetical protein